MVNVTGKDIYTDKKISSTLVLATIQLVDALGEARIHFDTNNPTKHTSLAYQLWAAVSANTDTYKATITNDLGCVFTKKEGR